MWASHVLYIADKVWASHVLYIADKVWASHVLCKLVSELDPEAKELFRWLLLRTAKTANPPMHMQTYTHVGAGTHTCMCGSGTAADG